MRRALCAVALLATTACSSEVGGEANDQSESSDAPDTMVVSGRLTVDDVFSVTNRPTADSYTCRANRDVGTDLSIGAQPFVVTDPDGSEVALGEVEAAEINDVGGRRYIVPEPGVCIFLFGAVVEDPVEGVYTLSVPDLDLETRFTSSDPTGIELEFRP